MIGHGTGTSDATEAHTDHRLAKVALPEHYDLKIVPDVESGRFDAVATISLIALEAVCEFEVNSIGLTIDEVQMVGPSEAVVNGFSRPSETEERIRIVLNQPLVAGQRHRLRIAYHGVFTSPAIGGIYLGKARLPSGDEQTMVMTHFCSVDARRAFPCWDEPDLKARFTVSLVIDRGLQAVSNEDVAAEELLLDGRKLVRFATTVPLSTYLVAFVIGRFGFLDPVVVDGVRIRVVVPEGKAALSRHALDVAVASYRFLSRYFDAEYPQRKIDHVAVPGFVGATENFGCITYSEESLLVDEKNASQAELDSVSTVIAHETSHMWFGDLVTTRWWNSVWLNESFATFMEYTTSEALGPERDAWAGGALRRLEAMRIDATTVTRTMALEVYERNDFEAMFDTLTYFKGTTLLTMLEAYIGADAFRRGINKFVSGNLYGNARPDDLWFAIESASDAPVRKIMRAWIEQPGYPLIRAERGARSGVVTLSQRRFSYSGESVDSAVWPVPIRLRVSIGGMVESRTVLLTEAAMQLEFDGDVDWIFLNDGGAGYYRCEYVGDVLPALVRQLTSEEASSALERILLLDESWAGVVRGSVEFDDFLEVIGNFEDERSPDVWRAVEAILRNVVLVADAGRLAATRASIRNLTSAALVKLDSSGDSVDGIGAVRGQLVRIAGTLGVDSQVIEGAKRQYETFLREPTSIPPDLVEPVSAVATMFDPVLWSALRERFVSTDDQAERVRCARLLNATDDVALLESGLNALLESMVSGRLGTRPGALAVRDIMVRPGAAEMGWSWLMRNWPTIRTTVHKYMLYRIFESVTSFTDRALATEARRWMETVDSPVGMQRRAELLERMDINVRLAERLASPQG